MPAFGFRGVENSSECQGEGIYLDIGIEHLLKIAQVTAHLRLAGAEGLFPNVSLDALNDTQAFLDLVMVAGAIAPEPASWMYLIVENQLLKKVG